MDVTKTRTIGCSTDGIEEVVVVVVCVYHHSLPYCCVVPLTVNSVSAIDFEILHTY